LIFWDKPEKKLEGDEDEKIPVTPHGTRYGHYINGSHIMGKYDQERNG